MDQPNLAAAADFIWRSARLLDRHRFAHHFLSAPSGPALAVLRAYQNPDGGFGNALEPDLRTPSSQPQPVEVALRVISGLGAMDDPMVGRACDYLASIATPEGGVPFVLPSASQHPCAPWWLAEGEQPPSLNPTAAIAGLLHRHGIRHPWLEPATGFCWRALESGAELGGYDAVAVLTFLQHVPDRPRAERVFSEVITPVLRSGRVVESDPTATGHVFTPLDIAPFPDSMARRLFDDSLIEAHLQSLVRRQQADGGWSISWSPPGQAAELEWRGCVTVGALLSLRANRVEQGSQRQAFR
jgi:hypothetical protein